MAARKKNSIKSIKKYKRKREMNIGIFIFALVFIYLIVTIIMYATTKKIAVYEVREGSILKDNSYTGLVIREETVVNAEQTGYINYFQNKDSKVKATSSIYAITAQKINYPTETVPETTLSSEEQKNLIIKTQSFNENYSAQKFSSVYSLKNEIANTLQSASNQTKTVQMSAFIAESGQEATPYTAPTDGIVVMNYDGLESLTTDNFKKSDLDRSKYTKTILEDNMHVKKGDPVYKLVTNEEWSVIIELDKDMAKVLSDTSVKTRIDKDSELLWADCTIKKKGNDYYGILSYSDSMIRYSEDRFLNIELIMEDESGLKVPKSSVLERDFFVIPSDYITTGGNSSSTGVMVQKRGNTAAFETVDIYKSTEDGKVYLSTEAFKKGTVLIKPESAETYSLSETKPLKGVYCINTGYSVFKHVTILAEGDEYYIIKEGESYGLSNYDRIVQESNSVKEEEVVY